MTAITPTADTPAPTDTIADAANGVVSASALDHPPAANTAATVDSSTSRSRVRFRDVVRGEWIKFWSVRSTTMTLVAAGVLTVALGMIFSAVSGSDSETPGPASFLTDPVEVALSGIGLTEMVIGVLGVLFVTSEYGTGLIRTAFAAVGRRSRIIRAKSVVVAASVFGVALASVTAAVIAGQAVYAGPDAVVPLADALGVVIGTTVYLVGVALIGVALGFILRSTAAAIGALVGGVFIGPNLLNLLPDSVTDVFLKYLPSEAGSAMMTRVADPDLLSTGAGYAVFLLWVVALLATAGIVTARRDA